MIPSPVCRRLPHARAHKYAHVHMHRTASTSRTISTSGAAPIPCRRISTISAGYYHEKPAHGNKKGPLMAGLVTT